MDAAANAEPTVLPEAVQLAPTFDVARLQTELNAVTDRRWDKQRIYHASGLGAPTDIDWRVLPLRSPSGAGDRTDPGGPGPEDFAPTPWLARMPYLREVLNRIPASLNAVRLMALGPGAISTEHRDPKYSLHRGLARLHIPIVTNSDALLILDGVTHHWRAGEFWFGDFSRPHRVENHGARFRIHVVIDALITRELIELFPQQWRHELAAGDVLLNRLPPPAEPSTCPWLPYSIDAPAAFTDFGHDNSLDPAASAARTRITTTNDQIRLIDADRRPFALVHLGQNEFRFAGWSEQRTIRLREDSVVLRTCRGRTVQEIALPAAAT